MLVMILVVTTQEVVMDNIVQSIHVLTVVVLSKSQSVPTIARHTNVWQVPAITEEVAMVCTVPSTPVLTQVVQARNRLYQTIV